MQSRAELIARPGRPPEIGFLPRLQGTLQGQGAIMAL
jgi:hypothetical protein